MRFVLYWIVFSTILLIGMSAFSENADAETRVKNLAMVKAEARQCQRRYGDSVRKRECVIRAAWPGDREDSKAVRVAHCETTGINPKRWDGTHSYYGVWQYDSAARRSYGYYGHSVLSQTLSAARMRRERGWSPWPRCGRL